MDKSITIRFPVAAVVTPRPKFLDGLPNDIVAIEGQSPLPDKELQDGDVSPATFMIYVPRSWIVEDIEMLLSPAEGPLSLRCVEFHHDLCGNNGIGMAVSKFQPGFGYEPCDCSCDCHKTRVHAAGTGETNG